MTARDFSLIARVLGKHYAEDERLVLSIWASFVIALRETNPKFDADRFLKAVLEAAKEQRK
jgi:hypothetical protein